ncbi:MAG: hypothetical protein JNJ94_00955 [Chlorobi bacterium]|nr:hypothetical protein [Chlorobiota bacterium]
MSPTQNSTLRTELLELAAADYALRTQLAADGTLFEGYNPQMKALHQHNSARLQEIIAQHGWPGRSLVGEDGTEAAWIVLQHSISNPEFMQEGLQLITDAAKSGEIAWNLVATTEDRVLMLHGEPQRYGTQHDWDSEGNLSPIPILNPETVDQRRAEIGLEPLAVQTERLRQQAALERERPRR